MTTAAHACDLLELSEQFSAEQALKWAFDTYYPAIAIASAFGAEGIVTIDIAAKICPDLPVFTVDTELLFPETLELIGRVEARYGIQVQQVRAAAEEKNGVEPELWMRNPDLCCQVRKLEPLRRKLARLRAWITSIRRDQTATRKSAGKIEWDSKFQLTKINPLADWTSEMVWHYIHKHGLDYNRLHDQGYPSIGCTPCTRPVRPGEDPRAGRWSGRAKTECGMHERHGDGLAPIHPSQLPACK